MLDSPFVPQRPSIFPKMVLTSETRVQCKGPSVRVSPPPPRERRGQRVKVQRRGEKHGGLDVSTSRRVKRISSSSKEN